MSLVAPNESLVPKVVLILWNKREAPQVLNEFSLPSSFRSPGLIPLPLCGPVAEMMMVHDVGGRLN